MTNSNLHDPPIHETARAAAVGELCRIEAEGAFVGFSGEDDAVDAREARQATEYVAGITRQRRWLDFLLTQFVHGDFADMEDALRQILRVGLYDLLFLRTPDHAAVSEAVELAKRLVRPGAGGLVNGVLRSVQRSAGDLPQPSTGSAERDLAIRHSHPTWMVRRWYKRFGADETAALLEWNNRRPAYGVRANPAKTPVEELSDFLKAKDAAFEPSPYLNDYLRVESLQPLVRSGWLAEGRAAVHDESAGLVVGLLDPQPGETVIDACAAPGGKALAAAARMQGEGQILAFDLHEGRLGLVREAAAAQGFADFVRTEVADLRALARRADAPQADRVLLDAPCSGLGVLAKRADLRWRRAPDDLRELARLQDGLLAAAAALVRPGGLLLYSTCTTEPEENEDRVRAFLAAHDDFALEPAAGLLPEAVQTSQGALATLPHRHHVDGAFAIRLRRS